MGRPTKFTPEAHRRIVEAVRVGTPRTAAAEYGGVTYQTFLNWMRRGEEAESGDFFEFFDAVTRAESECYVENVAILRKAATGWDTSETRTKTFQRQVLDPGGKPIAGPDGKPLMEEVTETVTTTGRDFDWRASLEILKRRHKADWSERVENQLSGPDGGPVQVQDVGAYSGMERGELNRGIEAALKPPAGGQR